MANIPIGYSMFSDDYWAFSGGMATALGGAASHWITWDAILAVSGAHTEDLIVDGVTMGVQIAAGSAWRLFVNGAPAIAHALGSGTAAAITPTYASFFPLNLPLRPWNGPMITIAATFAQFDTVTISAWGHYRPTPATPQTIPVKVEEVHIWPPKKKVGPV